MRRSARFLKVTKVEAIPFGVGFALYGVAAELTNTNELPPLFWPTLSVGSLAISGLCAHLERKKQDAIIDKLPPDERQDALSNLHVFDVNVADIISETQDDIEPFLKNVDPFGSLMGMEKLHNRFAQLPLLENYIKSAERLLSVNEAVEEGQDMRMPLARVERTKSGITFTRAAHYAYYYREKQLINTLMTVKNPGELPGHEYITGWLQACPAEDTFDFSDEFLDSLDFIYSKYLHTSWGPVLDFVRPYIENSRIRDSEINAGIAFGVLATQKAYGPSIKAHNKAVKQRIKFRFKSITKNIQQSEKEKGADPVDS